MTEIEFYVTQEESNERIDTVVAKHLTDYTRSFTQQLLKQGNVFYNGKTSLKSQRCTLGDCIHVIIPDAQTVEIVPQEIPLTIVYEDDSLLVVNKEKGMVVHPAPGNQDGTLVNALLYHCKNLSGINGELRPGIVHRIDKDTSGLLVVAKDNQTHRALSEQFSVHSIKRIYHTVVYGGFSEDTGFVEGQIGRHPVDRKKMAVLRQGGKYAYTDYKIEQRYVKFTHLSVQLKTGRTHQIRVHLASIGHPVAGDCIYGPHKPITQLHGQCLHAKTLGFVHPKTGQEMLFDSELPTYFTDFTTQLQNR